MIANDVSYRVGARALIFMMLRKLKYPALLAILMVGITYLFGYLHPTLLAWQSGTSPMLKGAVPVFAMIERYGWFFTVSLAVFLALTAVPEYRGLSVRFGDQAFYVRRGILAHREIAIPYRQIQTINSIESASESLFGLCALVVVTSAHDESSDLGTDSEATLPYIHKGLARDMQNELLLRSGKQ